jgi:hypothetical protein
VLEERDVKVLQHDYAAHHKRSGGSIMTKSTIAQVELLSQQLTRRFKIMNDLMSQAWLEHELAREAFRQLLTTYYKFLGKEGIDHEY